MNDVMVCGGFKYAHVIGELVNGNNIQSYGNENGICFGVANHANIFQRIYCAGNKNAIIPYAGDPGNSYLKIQLLDIEKGSYTSRWYGGGVDVNDPTNKLYGKLDYAVVSQGYGTDQASWSKIGGSNLTTTPLY